MAQRLASPARWSPGSGWNPSVFDILFHEHLADPAEARATLPLTLTSVQETLDQAIPTLD